MIGFFSERRLAPCLLKGGRRKELFMNKRLWWFGYGAAVGLTSLTLSLAAVPNKGRITDDTAIYQNLSEIRAMRERDLNFDQDLARLNNMEARYREKLPLAGPMKRISQRKYKR
jgi:hypothetical protein